MLASLGSRSVVTLALLLGLCALSARSSTAQSDEPPEPPAAGASTNEAVEEPDDSAAASNADAQDEPAQEETVAQDDEAETDPAADEIVEREAMRPPLTEPEPAPDAVSDAELIVELERSIEANKKEKERLQREQKGRESAYEQALQQFEQLDEQLEAKREELEAAQKTDDTEKIATLQQELEALQKQWQVAKDRWELEVARRKLENERIALLETLIVSEQKKLKELLGEAPAEAEAPAETTATDTPPSSAPPATAEATTPPAAADTKTAPPAQEPSPPAGGASKFLPGLPIPGLPGAADGTTAPGEAAPVPTEEPEEPKSEEVLEAEQTVEERTKALQAAEQRVQALNEQLQKIEENIANQRKLLETAYAQAENYRAARDLLSERERELWTKKGSDEEIQAQREELREERRKAERQVSQSVEEIRERTESLDELHQRHAVLLEARAAALREADAARRDLEAAQAKLNELTNPFTRRNLQRWFWQRGPAIASILFGMFLINWLIARFGSRVARMIAHRGSRGSFTEREDRANTLVGVFQNAMAVVILIGGGLMLLDQLGVPITPFLAAAGVLGLAISFGAQNLVSDFFYGFMILLENQYKLHDVIRINDHSGQVERISLRMTALRDLEGNLHFIPNGQVSSVVNMSHGWSRALFDIGVAYKENVDHVIEVIMNVGQELRKDPRFRMMILEDPTMLGVDAFGDSAVVIKFFIKTRPLQQWAIKREMLRRLKNRFDELGIEIPFPHRTIYHRTEVGVPEPMIQAFQASEAQEQQAIGSTS